jgi:hypothetical protein
MNMDARITARNGKGLNRWGIILIPDKKAFAAQFSGRAAKARIIADQ